MSGEQFLSDVYDASYRRLVVLMLAICGDQSEAEDAVQEAFVKAINSGNRFAALSNPEAWLRTVALNHLRNRWRHTAVAKRLLPRLPGPSPAIELSPDHVAVVTALQRIPFDLRIVVMLHHMVDQSVADIARQLGIAEGTVKSRLARGRAELAPLLDERLEAPPDGPLQDGETRHA